MLGFSKVPVFLCHMYLDSETVISLEINSLISRSVCAVSSVCSRDNYELHISVVAGKWTALPCTVYHTIPCSKYSAVYFTIPGHMVPCADGR